MLFGERQRANEGSPAIYHPHGVHSDTHEFRAFNLDSVTEVRLSFTSASVAACVVPPPPPPKWFHWPHLLAPPPHSNRAHV